MMSRIDLSRRQFINVTAASAGLYGMTGTTHLVLGEEPPELDGLDKMLRKGSKLPYIGITEDGPLYPPVEIPWLKDFTSINGPANKPTGQVLYLFGRILDVDGRPLPNATVEIWQSDTNGRYKHPRAGEQTKLDANFGYFGRVKTAADGTYLFKTIRPRWYDMFGTRRAAHIHLKMRHVEHGVLTTEMYFEGKEEDEIRSKDRVFQSRFTPDKLIVPVESPKQHASLDIKFEDAAICCKYDLAFLL
jgi:protocatechuate 3,4-dioxygenase beta subunit